MLTLENTSLTECRQHSIVHEASNTTTLSLTSGSDFNSIRAIGGISSPLHLIPILFLLDLFVWAYENEWTGNKIAFWQLYDPKNQFSEIIQYQNDACYPQTVSIADSEEALLYFLPLRFWYPQGKKERCSSRVLFHLFGLDYFFRHLYCPIIFMIVSETFNFLQRDLFEEARTLYFAQWRWIWKFFSDIATHSQKASK